MSGELFAICLKASSKITSSFHSISFPSEWGVHCQNGATFWSQVVSIQLVSPASGEQTNKRGRLEFTATATRFHSISFPNEWGGRKTCRQQPKNGFRVSIQLVCPASEELTVLPYLKCNGSKVSIQLVFPTSGEQRAATRRQIEKFCKERFPFNWFPQRVGS